MRRTSVMVAAAFALVVAGCSGGDGDPAPDGGPASADGSQPDADAGTERGSGGEGAAPGTAPPTPPAAPELSAREPTELPGLVDASDEPFPNDASVQTGTLANGLTYFVRFNDQPGARATLRLAVDAGSLDELDATTGVAHFAEHMLFNGTAAYPDNELVDVLRGFGADFGPDVNAYTNWNETVYQLEVPNDDASLAEAINVLSEWLSNATIDADQVVGERGVILDEWRVRTQTLRGRLSEAAQQLFLADTPYEGRSPIGTAADIEAMSAEVLREFYDAAYRPDNAAIVVVGDIDVDAMVARIDALFGAAEARGAAPPLPVDYLFEIDTEPDFVLHADRDQPTVDVEVTLPLPAIGGNGTRAARAALLDRAIYHVIVQRLDRDVAAGDAPFDRIVRGGNSLVDGLDAPALYAFTDADGVDATLTALLTEYERAFRHGFGAAEVESAVESLRAEWDARLAREFEIQDLGWSNMLVEHFLDGTPYPTVRDEYDLVVAELDRITPDSLARRFEARWDNSAPHVIISAPDALADQMPSRGEVIGAIEAVAEAVVDPRAPSRDLPDELMAQPEPVAAPEPRAMTDLAWAQLDPREYAFANGARVVLNPNTISQGSVAFAAQSPGGLSLVSDADAIDGLYAADVVLGGGVADFDRVEFAEITSSSTASLQAALADDTESFVGGTSSADAETLFQMIHLFMTEPRFDQVALDQVVRRERPSIEDPSINPPLASADALSALRYGDEVRLALLPTPEQFATLDLDGVERVWRDRFGDASDWVFVFSGDLDLREFEQLAAAYIGTLPGDRGPEQAVPLGDAPPESVRSAEVRAGTGDTASVEMLFPVLLDEVSPRNRALAAVATAVLDARLTRVIREEFGDSYSPHVRMIQSGSSEPTMNTFVSITGAPDRVDVIAETVIATIADITSGGLGEEEYATALAPVAEDYSFVDNRAYLRELLREALIADYDFDGYVLAPETLAAVDRDDVVRAIERWLPVDRYVQVTVLPR